MIQGKPSNQLPDFINQQVKEIANHLQALPRSLRIMLPKAILSRLCTHWAGESRRNYSLFWPDPQPYGLTTKSIASKARLEPVDVLRYELECLGEIQNHSSIVRCRWVQSQVDTWFTSVAALSANLWQPDVRSTRTSSETSVWLFMSRALKSSNSRAFHVEMCS